MKRKRKVYVSSYFDRSTYDAELDDPSLRHSSIAEEAIPKMLHVSDDLAKITKATKDECLAEVKELYEGEVMPAMFWYGPTQMGEGPREQWRHDLCCSDHLVAVVVIREEELL